MINEKKGSHHEKKTIDYVALRAKLFQIFIIALAAAIADQIRINPDGGFFWYPLGSIVSFAAALFILEMEITHIHFVAFFGSAVWQILLFFFGSGSIGIVDLISIILSRAVYYCFVCFFMVIIEFREQKGTAFGLFGMAMLLDSIASLCETLCRTNRDLLYPGYLIISSVIFSSFFRSSLVVTLYYSVQRERVNITKRSEKANSEQLLMLLTGFYTEAFFLRKSSSDIESTMARCYELYRIINRDKEQIPDGMRLTQQTLEIAKDIHEIKKDYQRIISGMERLIKLDSIGESMQFQDLVQVIIASNQAYSLQLKKQISFASDIKYRFLSSEFHSLISILNNLVSNAVEAIDHDYGHVTVGTMQLGWHIFITVMDDGPGIDEDDQQIIFAPGYTTKFSGSGQQSTGIGLTHVRSLVTGLGGEVMVSSVPGETIFTVILPRERIEHFVPQIVNAPQGAGDSQVTIKE